METEEQKTARLAAEAEAAKNGEGEGKNDEGNKKPDSEKTIEELKAEAEAAEGEYKKNRDGGGATEEEIRQNYIRRRDKAMGKAETIKNGEQSNTKPKNEETFDTRDLVTLATEKIAEDSEKAKILAKYKNGGIIKNVAEGLVHPGIKAEFDALDAKNNAKSVIDENDSAETKLKTTKEAVAAYKNSGEVPEDPKLRKAVADENLKEMGF